MIKEVKKLIPASLKREVKLIIKGQKRVSCPFCNISTRDLKSIGFDFPVLVEKHVIGGGVRLAQCPECGSTDRERLLYIYLRDELNFFGNKNKSILHIAPEKRLLPKFLESNFTNYVCGDLFTPGYTYPDYVQNVDITNITFPDNSFDLILCNHVLEHIPTDTKAMKELSRILKKDGIAILQVPISKNSENTVEDFSITEDAERERRFGQFDHVRIYGQDYIKRLESSGFKVNRLNISRKYRKYGLNREEDLFICSKA